MAGVSYLIRMLPLTLIRKEIKNKTYEKANVNITSEPKYMAEPEECQG